MSCAGAGPLVLVQVMFFYERHDRLSGVHTDGVVNEDRMAADEGQGKLKLLLLDHLFADVAFRDRRRWSWMAAA